MIFLAICNLVYVTVFSIALLDEASENLAS